MEETQPLLGIFPEANVGGVTSEIGATSAELVDFDPDDVENPVNWPTPYKWGIVALISLMAFTVTFTCISVVPVANRIVDDLGNGQSSKSARVLLVTIWEFGEAGGPLLIAPLSEMFGRYPVINVANFLFIFATVAAALCQSTSLFIATRALTGFAVATNVLGPAIIGDMFIPEQRGSPMSMTLIAPLLGGAVGPAISGAIAQSLGWRQVIWMSALLACVVEVAFLLLFRETYKVRILRQRAARLRKETGKASLKTSYDMVDTKDSRKLRDSILRPVMVLYGSGVLQSLSLYGSIAFSYFYVLSTTLPDILEMIYGLSPALIGSAFLSFSIGSAVSVLLLNLTLDRIYVKLRDSHNGVAQPEYRLPLAILGGILLPAFVTSYGWIAQKHASLAVLLLNVALLGMTLILAFVPLTSYVVDAFDLYSASALTALIVVRCLMGTFLPLATAPLVGSFGYGLGFTVFGVVSLCLVPIPILVLRYGPKWRQLSPYTRDAAL